MKHRSTMFALCVVELRREQETGRRTRPICRFSKRAPSFAMSELGHERQFGDLRRMSDLHPASDVFRTQSGLRSWARNGSRLTHEMHQAAAECGGDTG